MFKIKFKMKEPLRSSNLPEEKQFKENWGWENSFQRYEMDQEFQDKWYFECMEPNDLIKLVRKMENFFMERGISIYFMRNYLLASKVFEELE